MKRCVLVSKGEPAMFRTTVQKKPFLLDPFQSDPQGDTMHSDPDLMKLQIPMLYEDLLGRGPKAKLRAPRAWDASGYHDPIPNGLAVTYVDGNDMP